MDKTTAFSETPPKERALGVSRGFFFCAMMYQEIRRSDAVIDWPMTFSTMSQAIKLANELRSIDKEISQAELKLKVAELTGSLAEIKLTLTDAKSEAAEKDEEIARLKKLQQRLSDETVELYGYRYRKRKDGKEGGAGNPMCDVCLQKNGLLIEMAQIAGKGIQALKCPNCKAEYAHLHTYTD